MNTESNMPQRKNNRLKYHDYSSFGAYFITVCTANRKNYFWQDVGAIIDRPQDVKLSSYGKITEEAILKISSSYPSISIDSYVIMPNHIHLLLSIAPKENGRSMIAPTISQVIKQLKGYVSKKIGTSVWQKSFHDHIIRNREDYNEHLWYIYENPIRWMYDDLFSDE